MKYFTRDLYQRCRSSDEAVLSVACEEWEQANERYERHLQAIEPRLPAHLREFAGLLLHDARVQSIGQEGNRLIVVLHMDVPPRDLVILNYELEGDPIVEPFAATPGDWSGLTDFQFDELDIIREGEHPLYSQAIVFGNGWLMHLRFRDVQVTVARPVWPGSAASLTSGSSRNPQSMGPPPA